MANPRAPAIAGADAFTRAGGQLLHSAGYRRPNDFIGKRVLVVGVGNSGGEIASELARARARVTIAVRSGANVVPREILGIPIQYLARYIRKLPRRAREAVVRAVGKIVEKRRGPPVLPRPAYGPLDAIPLTNDDVVVSIHACGALTDRVLERAADAQSRVAVLPCCHDAAVCDAGVVADMRGMKGISVDANARIARAEAGLTWGEFDAATQEHGLACTGGRVSTTGIAGLALGSYRLHLGHNGRH